MATILKSEKRDFKADSNKIDNYRLFTDISRLNEGLVPENLNFDVRCLNPGQFSAPYHFHRYAEELFMITSGSATLRTPEGFQILEIGDIAFFSKGNSGAHQLYNHGSDPCIYLDVRTFIGYDVCEYPDSDKILLAPSFEIFRKDSVIDYFEGEDKVSEKWK